MRLRLELHDRLAVGLVADAHHRQRPAAALLRLIRLPTVAWASAVRARWANVGSLAGAGVMRLSFR